MIRTRAEESGSPGLVVPQMDDESKRKRPYDDRHSRLMRIASGLIDLGCRPRVIELDGLYVELDGPDAAVQTQSAEPRTAVTPITDPADEGALRRAEAESVRPIIRSYRARAQDELQRKIRDIDGEAS